MGYHELPSELDRAVDSVLVAVHYELEARDQLGQPMQSSLRLLAQLSEEVASAATIAAAAESHRVDIHSDADNERNGSDPHWLDYRDHLIRISALALEAGCLHAIHPEPDESDDRDRPGDAEYFLALGYWALREAFDERGANLGLAEWQLGLTGGLGEASHSLELAYRGIEQAEPIELPAAASRREEVTPSFAVGQVGVRFVNLAGVAMLGAAALACGEPE